MLCGGYMHLNYFCRRHASVMHAITALYMRTVKCMRWRSPEPRPIASMKAHLMSIDLSEIQPVGLLVLELLASNLICMSLFDVEQYELAFIRSCVPIQPLCRQALERWQASERLRHIKNTVLAAVWL